MKRNKNRILVMLCLATLMCGCLASCGKSDTDGTKSSEDVLTEIDTTSTEALDDSTEAVSDDANIMDAEGNEVSSESSSSDATENKKSDSSDSSSGSTENKKSDSSDSSSESSSNSSSHSHTWVAVKTVVHHDEVGHYEQDVLKDAYDETVATRVYDPWKMCLTCGADVTSDEHTKNCNGTQTETIYYKTVTEIIHHDAEYGTHWVVDTAAYDEEVITGYKCSSCEATK